MTARYRVDPGPSRFTVQGFATGLLSVFAHSPTFAVRNFAGEVEFDDGRFEQGRLVLTARSDSLELVDAVRPADRAEIQGRMRGEVLEVGAFPEIRLESADVSARPVAGNRYRLLINGVLALHGVANRQVLEAEMLAFDDGIRVTGETVVRLSDYHVRPVTALGGAIRLRDELRVAFDLAVWKEG
jgi:polyisoprenoid-binding protein YceI